MIKEYKVEPYAEVCICDKCKEGEMIPIGENQWLSNPPKFKHKCTICDNEEFYIERYPVIKYRIVIGK